MKEVKKPQAVLIKPAPKETQGHKKMLQRVEDLKRNKGFLRDFKKYNKFSNPSGGGFAVSFDLLFEKYMELNEIAKRLQKKYDRNFLKTAEKMAEAYGLDSNLLGFISFSMDKELSKYNHFEDYLDMCVFEDNNSKYLLFDYTDLPLIFNPAYKNHLRAYPVSIDIHKYASKRDVLDYIEKNWEKIYINCLGEHTDYKPMRFRKRKIDREIVDFIWASKTLKGKEIKKLLDEKFPHNGIIYYEIPKIISIERGRRLS